jgi:hypothetical protein
MKSFRTLIAYVFLFLDVVTIGFLVVLTTSFDREPYVETNYTAILMTRDELEKSIGWQAPQPITVIGKIYKKDHWILITEKFKGIHLIDNSDPTAPKNTGFIRVPGCIDIAVKEGSLYADNSVDLVTIDMAYLPEIRVTSRIRNIFPEPFPPDLLYMPAKFRPGNRPGNTIIVEWEKIR